MISVACPDLRFLIFFEPQCSTVVAVVVPLVMIGIGVGWLCRSSAGPRRSVEYLTAFVLVLMMGWRWVEDIGNPLWFLLALPVFIAMPVAGPVLAVTLSFTISVAIGATVREDRDPWRRLGRIALFCAFVPASYFLIYTSGIWPNRATAAYMEAVFQARRDVFDRIAVKYEEALPPECRPICASRPPPQRPDDLELWCLFASIGSGPAYWRTDGELHIFWHQIGGLGGELTKGYVYSRATPGPLVNDPERAVGNRSSALAVYKHLRGNWYLMFARG